MPSANVLSISGEIADTPEQKYQYQEMTDIDAESLLIARFIRNNLAPSLTLIESFAIVRSLKSSQDDPNTFEDLANKLMMTVKLTHADEVSQVKQDITQVVEHHLERDRKYEEERARISDLAKRNFFEKNREGLKLKKEVLDFAAAISWQQLKQLDARQQELVELFKNFDIEIYRSGWFSPRWTFRGSNTYENFRNIAEAVEGQDFELFMQLGSHARAIARRQLNGNHFGGLSVRI